MLAWLTPAHGAPMDAPRSAGTRPKQDKAEMLSASLPDDSAQIPAVPPLRDGHSEGWGSTTRKPVVCSSTATGRRDMSKEREEKRKGVKTPLSRVLDALNLLGVPKGI